MRRGVSCLTAALVTLLGGPASAAQIYSNGPLSTGPTSESGVAAPAGTTWSELQHDVANMTQANNSAGVASVAGAVRLADDFTVPAGQVWTITNIDFYAYLTNNPPATSPIAGYTVQVWEGLPGEPTSTVIAGNTSTNVLTSSTDALIFRIGNTAVPPPGLATNTARKVWRNRVTFAQPLVLTAGTYWLDWDLTDNNAAANAFSPSVTVVGTRTQANWNARQLNISNGTWNPILDLGNPDTAPDVAADMPFDIQGSACGDGNADAPETCDDGNLTDDDGCDSNCTPTACGNGILTPPVDCDDGNAVDGDGCDSNCTPSSCGNGVAAPDEECDDNNTDDGDGCDSNCTNTACGNGILTGAEVCDDGNLDDGDDCDSNCTVTACGNGVVSDPETCDDGNLEDGDDCDSNCTPTGCGNTITTAPEQCDDGNDVPADGCEPDCTLTDGVPCTTPEDCPNGFCVEGVCCDSECGGDDLTDCQACTAANGAVQNGKCTVLSVDAVCRPAAAACDAAELCDGAATACPEDIPAEDGTECRGGACELGQCVPDSDSTTTTGETTTGEPDTTTGEPDTTTGEPDTTGEPLTTTGEPVTTTGEPVTTTGEPTTTAPATTGDTPTSSPDPTNDPGDESETDDDTDDTGNQTDDGGCGCSSASDTWPTALALPWLLLGGAARRRRPRTTT
jgi:MYXO-CTERM domain-containing protein